MPSVEPSSSTIRKQSPPSSPGFEPNMKLSRAIVVMVLLHVVAIGGVLAFSMIKDRAPAPVPPPTVVNPGAHPTTILPTAQETPKPLPITKSVLVSPEVYHKDAEFIDYVRSTKPVAPSISKPPPPKTPKVSKRKIYYVIKGDTLYSIARHFKTTPKTLSQLNKISDPTKLRIGQKLVLPPPKK